MDNKIILLGVIHFKKNNNIRNDIFTISYLTSEGEYKIKEIKGIAIKSDIVKNITNGMVVIINGQLLYNEIKDRFIISVENILPIKDRSGCAVDTILLQYENSFNNFYIPNNIELSRCNKYLITHPKPIAGDLINKGILKIEALKKLGIKINTNLIIGE